jgi:hypothetical protein
VLPFFLYRKLISPALPPTCIYEPTCSHYAINAVMRHGLIKGLILGVARIFRCVGIFFSGGPDEVPESFSLRTIAEDYRRFLKKRGSK